jgi:predicted 3-demethylubiquinone-9 3-methyltransferase (glyoxalase superfamily)
MIRPIVPCFWFDSQAQAAAEFYGSLIRNSTITSNTPVVVNFELAGGKFMGLNGGPMFHINPSISLFVRCESLKETDTLWEKLLDGGSVLMPIDTYPWSARYGWLRDRFGLTWQLSLAEHEEAGFKITPALLFTGNQFGKAEEAVHFYGTVFRDSSVDQLIHYPKGADHAGKVMYSEFNLDHYDLIAMDGPGSHDYMFNEAVSFVVTCETQAEIDHFWEKLTEGGQESRCGWLKDKFGVSWQIIPSILGKLMGDPQKAGKVFPVMQQMKKLNIEKLVASASRN